MKITLRTLRLPTDGPRNVSRIPTGIQWLDRVLGGGLAKGYITVISGMTAAGTSTLASQMAMSIESVPVVYANTEEGLDACEVRFRRFGRMPIDHSIMTGHSLYQMICETEQDSVFMIDTINNISAAHISSDPEREVSINHYVLSVLSSFAYERKVAVVLIARGSPSNERVERWCDYAADTVLQISKECIGNVTHVLRCLKSDHHHTNGVAALKMTDAGFVETGR